MSNRFGRNQKRKLRASLRACETALAAERSFAQQSAVRHKEQIAAVLRHNMESGRVPMTVEHFIDPQAMRTVIHVIMDERRENLHYQHAVSELELTRLRDTEEREMFALYLGRAIADLLADAFAERRRAA